MIYRLLTVPVFFLIFTAISGAEPNRPNVVFILADDLGVNDVGAYNSNTFYETPHLDRLADEGMKLTTAYSACNVCSPTRYSIMTGKYPARSGLTNWLPSVRIERFLPAPLTRFMSLDEKTIGEAFQEAGYRTALFGKWHLGNAEDYGPQKQGFEMTSGDILYVAPSIKNFALPDRQLSPKGEKLRSETNTDHSTENALLFLEKFQDEPFFLYLSFNQVHSPIGASERYSQPFETKKEKLFPQYKEEDDFIEEIQWNITDKKKRHVRVRQNHPVYAAMVSHTDKCVGRILDKLEQLKLSEKTILVFMSDNGGLSTCDWAPTSNLPLRCGKGWNYEGGIRVPMIVRWTGKIPAGSVCDVPLISTDWYPTLLDLVGLPPKPEQHLDGVSFAGLLRNEKTQWKRDALFWHYPHYTPQGGFPSSAVRMGDYKLIQHLEDGKVQLYNLKEDAGEKNDLAAANPDKAAALQQRLFKWYKETNARFLRENNGKKPWFPLQ